MASRPASLAIFLLAAGVAGGGGAAAQEAAEWQVRGALRRQADRTWYDAGSDEARAVALPPIRRPANRPQTNSGGGGAPPAWDLNLQWLMRAALVILLVIVAVALFYAYRRMVEQRRRRTIGPVPTPRGAGRLVDVSALPEEAAGGIDDLLAAADAAAAAGRFDRALVLLFSHELTLLHAAGVISLDRGKTNRTYVREASSRSELIAPFRRTVHQFERVYFGAKEASADDWRELRREESLFPQGAAS